jgi:hypothetical protein
LKEEILKKWERAIAEIKDYVKSDTQDWMKKITEKDKILLMTLKNEIKKGEVKISFEKGMMWITLTKKGMKKINKHIKRLKPFILFLKKLEKVDPELILKGFSYFELANLMWIMEKPSRMKGEPFLSDVEKFIGKTFLELYRMGIKQIEKRKEELDYKLSYIR